ncbi:uncharacterized protein LOC119685981 isoform X2 [Teleopsis dalmanni]|uniref:uncharacterized protein LOC119685981 isoform X2 n=1 Tax=Teleopsis dalmanni TaxID=139649 RepID=UPI0018CEA938|nr:uncharacterized protein LOC119685981 isoform X2 [Teleopsis dalmanni]
MQTGVKMWKFSTLVSSLLSPPDKKQVKKLFISPRICTIQACIYPVLYVLYFLYCNVRTSQETIPPQNSLKKLSKFKESNYFKLAFRVIKYFKKIVSQVCNYSKRNEILCRCLENSSRLRLL